MREQSELRTKIEKIFVKMQHSTICEHDIMDMLNLDEKDLVRVKQMVRNMKQFGFVESANTDTCEKREVAHIKFQATKKLTDKYGDFEEADEKEKQEEKPVRKKRKYKRRAKKRKLKITESRDSNMSDLLDEIIDAAKEAKSKLEKYKEGL